MVVALGPGKFYGSSLPRPYIYTDVKHNDARVDPPRSVMDPLMTWAEEAHWSMGGLNVKRHRLQGRIEGNVNKLRAQREHEFKVSHKQQQQKPVKSSIHKDKNSGGVSNTPSPPPAPMVIKRRRVIGLVDEDDDEEEEEQRRTKRGTVRKLEDEFERVAERTRSKRNEAVVVNKGKITKGKKKLVKGGRNVGGIRSSPRLVRGVC